MIVHPTSHTRRSGRLLASATAVFTVLLLAALAVPPARADVVFTRNTTLGEQFAQYTATYTAPNTGNYTLGFNLTAPLSGDNSIFIDAVKVTNGATTVFSDGFETPALAANTGVSANGGSATFGAWAFSNYSGILNGSPPNWGLAGYASIGGGSGQFTLAPADGTHQYAYLQAVSGTLGKMKAVNTLALVAGQTYTISFYQASRYDFGGSGTYTVTLDFVPPTIHWVNWTGTDTSSGITKYVGNMVVPRTGGSSTTVIVKYTPPTQDLGVNWAGKGYWPGICFPQFSNGTDYFAQGSAGSLGRNPARSPYTSAKVANIPDGGGAASDKGDIIALQFAGTNTLDFFDASTGLPIAIASPVFAYVSLNGNGYGFNQDFDILSFGDGVNRNQGYWGAGSSRKNVAVVGGETQYQLLQDTNPLGGTEPHGALQFRGSFSTVKWQSLASEIWNGFTIGVAQLAADVPIANAGPDQTVNATSTSGASVQLSGSVSGSTNAPFTFTWTGSFGTATGSNPTVTLPVGTHTITLTVTDAAGASDTDTVVITVTAPVDTTPPVITGPGNLTREATGPTGAVVTFTATATDAVDGPVAVVAIPSSGSTFPLGMSTVDLGASDHAGNVAHLTFTVTVRDTIAPVVSVPGNITAEATSASGAVVSYPAPTATDAVGVTSLIHSPASGSTFPLGTTTVTVTAKDAAGNTSTGSFTVTVKDTTAPALTVPASQTLEATSAAGAAATFSASATDAVGVTSLTYSAASGSTFPLGTTTVTVTAKDAAGNTSTGSFTIPVKDTTAPALTVPANVVAEATSASGAAVSYPAATATDAVGVTSLTYSAASGSTFPLGTTTVTVTAKDAAGNTSTGSFTITVRDTTAPTLTSVTPSTGTLWPPNHQMVAITLNSVASDLVGVAGYVVTATSSEPDNGLGDGDTANDIQISGSGTLAPVVNLRAERAGNGNGRTYTITVQAKDAAGNLSAPKTTTVFVPKSQGGKK
jgi:hypothetical protein